MSNVVLDLEVWSGTEWRLAGIALRAEGEVLLCCAHTVMSGDRIRVRDEQGVTRSAAVVDLDATTDIALLKNRGVPWSGDPLRWPAQTISRGDEVVVTGTLGLSRRAAPLPLQGRVTVWSRFGHGRLPCIWAESTPDATNPRSCSTHDQNGPGTTW